MEITNLEQRYVIFKISDLDNLTSQQQREMISLQESVVDNRKNSGKLPLHCLVIESDWPEYQPVREMLLKRINSG